MRKLPGAAAATDPLRCDRPHQSLLQLPTSLCLELSPGPGTARHCSLKAVARPALSAGPSGRGHPGFAGRASGLERGFTSQQLRNWATLLPFLGLLLVWWLSLARSEQVVGTGSFHCWLQPQPISGSSRPSISIFKNLFRCSRGAARWGPGYTGRGHRQSPVPPSGQQAIVSQLWAGLLFPLPAGAGGMGGRWRRAAEKQGGKMREGGSRRKRWEGQGGERAEEGAIYLAAPIRSGTVLFFSALPLKCP